MKRHLADFVDTYTKDLTAEDLQRLFTRDTPDAYRFFTRAVDPTSLEGLPVHRQVWTRVRALFMAFTMKLTPARRVLYAVALLLAVVGMFNLFVGIRTLHLTTPLPIDIVLPVPVLAFREGTSALVEAFILMNLLVLLEVADRLSLKNDLEVARDIQQAMLPRGLFAAPGVETVGISRPANTVGGDFYDILPLGDGRVVIAVGDVAGKGSPAALLMALLLAMLRTLVDEKLEPAELVTRLNVQVSRHALHHAALRGVRSGDRTPHLRERRPHAAAGPAADGRMRAAHRRGHRARHVRTVDLLDRPHGDRSRRSAGDL